MESMETNEFQVVIRVKAKVRATIQPREIHILSWNIEGLTDLKKHSADFTNFISQYDPIFRNMDE